MGKDRKSVGDHIISASSTSGNSAQMLGRLFFKLLPVQVMIVAMGAFNMVCTIFTALAIGTGAVVRMLGSVLFGEEDRGAIKAFMGLALRRMMLFSLAFAVVILPLCGPIAGLFFPDRTTVVYGLAHRLFLLYAVLIPLIVLCQLMINYLQAAGRMMFVNLISIFDGLISVSVPALILAPLIGADGVWIAFPIGIVLTLLVILIYICMNAKHFPRSQDEWLLLPRDFGVSEEDCLSMDIGTLEQSAQCSEQVNTFCLRHGFTTGISMHTALCAEELADNVILHGFRKDSKKHSINVRLVYTDETILLRMKDDCGLFDPAKYAQMLSDDEPGKHIGLRMVRKIADEMLYQNLMGLNVISIWMKDKS